MNNPDWWPDDYFASRERFCAQALQSGAKLQSHPMKAAGPRGEPLFIDTAKFVSPDTQRMIVLTSGVHGVEGFIGACVQVKALQTLATTGLPAKTGVALIHAVNPWGYAHLRRVNEDNIDINRNFIDPRDRRPPIHPQYASLDSLINPRGAPEPGDRFRFLLNVGKQIARYRGVAKLAQIIATGQYEYPQGLFYGGGENSESTDVLQRILLDLSAGIDQIIHLDLHSGLGRSAVATLIANSNAGSPEQCKDWIQTHYGKPVYFENAKGNAYNARGTLAQWYQSAFIDKRFLYLCVETGTVNPVKVFSALRRENQTHHWTPADSQLNRASKQALLEVFAPRSGRWRRNSLAEGMSVLSKTLEHSEKLSERSINNP